MWDRRFRLSTRAELGSKSAQADDSGIIMWYHLEVDRHHRTRKETDRGAVAAMRRFLVEARIEVEGEEDDL